MMKLDEDPVGKASQLLVEKTNSEDLANNIEAAEELLHGSLIHEPRVRDVLESFRALKPSYLGSCSQLNIDQVHAMYDLVSDHSRCIPFDRVQSRHRLSMLAQRSYEHLVRDCLDDFVREYLQLKGDGAVGWSYNDHRHFDLLIADANPPGIPKESITNVVKKLVHNLRRVNFDKLRNLSSFQARKRWVNFYLLLSDRDGVEIFQMDPKTEKYQASKEAIWRLYESRVKNRCESITNDDAASLMSRLDDLTSWCRPDMIADLFNSQVGVHMMHRMVNYRVCEELKKIKTEEFLDLMKRELSNRIPKHGYDIKKYFHRRSNGVDDSLELQA